MDVEDMEVVEEEIEEEEIEEDEEEFEATQVSNDLLQQPFYILTSMQLAMSEDW